MLVTGWKTSFFISLLSSKLTISLIFYQHKGLTYNYELGYHWKSYEWEMSHTIWIFEFTIFLRSICALAEVASCWSGLKSGLNFRIPRNSFTCVGRLWRSRHNTIDAILIQWHVNKLRGILKLLRNLLKSDTAVAISIYCTHNNRVTTYHLLHRRPLWHQLSLEIWKIIWNKSYITVQILGYALFLSWQIFKPADWVYPIDSLSSIITVDVICWFCCHSQVTWYSLQNSCASAQNAENNICKFESPNLLECCKAV